MAGEADRLTVGAVDADAAPVGVPDGYGRRDTRPSGHFQPQTAATRLPLEDGENSYAIGHLRFLRHADVEGHLLVGELLVGLRMPVGDDLYTRFDQVKAREEPGDFVS